MKAYLIPLKGRKRIAIGSEGTRITGPILYVPGQGAIVYLSSIIGYAERMGTCTIGADRFESDAFFLEAVDRQMHRERLEAPYDTEECNLSQGVLEVDIPKEEFQSIATEAEKAYSALNRFRQQALILISDLERKLGREKLGHRVTDASKSQ